VTVLIGREHVGSHPINPINVPHLPSRKE
jgi:hypothetical protein